MLEELRIKCPSCGIILDVRNSRHEAVKRIKCPNCKKLLAVDFQVSKEPTVRQELVDALYYGQERLPLREGINKIPFPDCQQVDIQVLRLSKGGYKCVVQSLSTTSTVSVNGQPLEPEDKVVLAIGDELQVGTVTLSYGKPGKAEQAAASTLVNNTSSESARDTKHKGKTASKSAKGKYATAGIAVLVAILVVYLLRTEEDVTQASALHTETAVAAHADSDSTIVPVETATKEVAPPPPTAIVSQHPTPSTPSEMSEYELEQAAIKGDVDAQYELGRRWVSKRDSTNVVKGIQYLRLASRNGSVQAQNLLQVTFSTLDRAAANGSQTAANILTEQKR